MAPPPPTVELADIEDYDSDPDYEMEIPDGNTRRKVRFVEPTNKKRGATRATRGSIQKSASTRKTSTSVTVKKGSIASQKPASTSHTSPKKKSGQSGSTPVSRMSSPRKRT